MTRGRPRQFDERAVLEQATAFFWDEGYDRGSMDRVLEATGLSKSSVYRTFGGKGELFARCVTHYVDEAVRSGHQALRESESAESFIRDLVMGCAGGPEARARGCFLLNAAQNLPDDDAVRAAVRSGMKRHEALFETALLQAQAEGSLSSDADLALLAQLLFSTLAGLKLMGRAGYSKQSLRKTGEVLLSQLFG